MKKTIQVIIALSLFFSSFAFAFTAIAYPPDQGIYWYASHGNSTQKEADAAAIDGCKVYLREKGKANLAKLCKVQLRQKAPGYAAVSCGDNGCSYATGYAVQQEVLDYVYQDCSKSYSNCENTNMSGWLDENFPLKKGSNKSNVKPVYSVNTQRNVVRCSNQCTNGFCNRTFSDGRKDTWQAPWVFNSLRNNWEWDITTNACGL